MEFVLGRYRNLIVLVAVLFAQVLGLAVQVKRTTDSESTRLIRVWAVGAVTPPEKALHWVQTSASGVWHNYLYLRGIRAENRELRHEIEQMKIEEARMSQDVDQAHRLQALLLFKEKFISQTLAAQVIGSSGSEQSRSVYIDKGARQGIKADMAVITKDGIVGKVLQTYGANALETSVSQVLLINDQSSGVGVILDKSRLQGILRGTPSGDVVLEKVMSDETVQVGDQVLTSGGDGIFPKGLPVGTVTKVSPGNDLFLNIRVRPAANLNRIEEVLVVTKIDERQAQPEQTGPLRAIDILAERLPTVPPKADSAAASAGKTLGTAQQGANATPSASAVQTNAGAMASPTSPPAGRVASHPGSQPRSQPGAAADSNKPKFATPSAAGAQGTGMPSASGPNGNVIPAPRSSTTGSSTTGSSGGVVTSTGGGAVGSATATPAATKPATKPVNTTVVPKPQPAAENAPQ